MMVFSAQPSHRKRAARIAPYLRSHPCRSSAGVLTEATSQTAVASQCLDYAPKYPYNTYPSCETLERRAHEQDTICRQLNSAVLFKGASAGRV